MIVQGKESTFGEPVPRSAGCEGSQKVIAVYGPDGEIITMSNLPKGLHSVWRWKNKAMILAAVHGGLVTMEEVARCYGFTKKELMEWAARVRTQGFSGLRVDALDNEPTEGYYFTKKGGFRPKRATLSGFHTARGLDIDFAKGLVWVHGGMVHLTGNELAIVDLLVAAEGAVVSHQQFFAHLYGDSPRPSHKILSVYMVHLRKKLHPVFVVQSVKGRGYHYVKQPL